MRKVDLLCYKGAIKLGRGDLNIGSKVPIMMKQLGLVDVEIRLNDKVRYLYPPYDDPIQQNILLMIKKRVLNQGKFWLKRAKEEFLAGGGKLKEKAKKVIQKTRATFKKQLEDGTYFSCHAGFFYVIKGRKAKN